MSGSVVRAFMIPVLLLTSGCWEAGPGDQCETAQELFGSCTDDSSGWGGGGGADGGGGSTYVPKSPSIENTSEPTFGCSGYPICPIAVGGAGKLTIAEHDGIDTKVVLGDGPATVSPWFTTSTQQGYLVTGTNIPGVTPLTIVSDNWAPVEASIITSTVREVRFAPVYPYETQTAEPAYAYAMRDVVLEILGGTIEAPVRLVDETLTTLPASDPEHWDRFTLSAEPGTQTFVLTADSIGTREVSVDMVLAIDRVEVSLDVAPAVGRHTRVCFHGYLGEREVIVPVDMVVDASPVAWPHITNCTSVSFATTSSRHVIIATAGGIERTVELLVAPLP